MNQFYTSALDFSVRFLLGVRDLIVDTRFESRFFNVYEREVVLKKSAGID